MHRVQTVRAPSRAVPFDIVVLTHSERHLRRKVLTLQHGDRVLVDLPEPMQLAHGARLVLDDGREAEVIAAAEEVMEVVPRDGLHLVELAWHIGNRHLPAQIERSRILVERDHVIRDMLIGLGARVRNVSEPFQPVRGAYHASGGHAHAHSHDHARDQEHGEAHAHDHHHDRPHSHR